MKMNMLLVKSRDTKGIEPDCPEAFGYGAVLRFRVGELRLGGNIKSFSNYSLPVNRRYPSNRPPRPIGILLVILSVDPRRLGARFVRPPVDQTYMH